LRNEVVRHVCHTEFTDNPNDRRSEMGDLLVRAADAARFLGVSTRTLERWSTEGTNGLPEPVRLGSRADRYYPAKVIYAVAETIEEH
jgi:predicted DNA-binding transcriptional regulator AlpA